VRSLNAALQAAIMAENTSACPLILLTITHPSLGEPIRLVNNNLSLSGATNIVRGADTYVAFPFELELPSDLDADIPRARLKVTNVSREVAALARVAGEAPKVMIEVIEGQDPSLPGVFFGPLQFAEPLITDMEISTELVTEHTAFLTAVYPRFDAAHFPALHRAAA
jgi:hypothetical protein